MAVELRTTRRREQLPVADRELLADVQRLEAFLLGECFGVLNFWRRAATQVAVKLALLGIGASKHIELATDGWKIKSTEDVADVDQVALNDRIAASYSRDYASQRARIALRPRPPEAADRYFTATDDEDTGELSPALENFRARTAFQMQQA